MALHIIPTDNALQTTLAGNLSISETGSFSISDDWSTILSGMSATRPVTFTIDRLDANQVKTPTKREYITATGISGTTISGLTRGVGGSTAQAHSAGAIVEVTLDVTAIASITDTFLVGHTATGEHASMTIAGTSSESAYIRLAEDTDNGTNYMGIQAPAAVTTSKTLILPDGDGTANQVLKTDGSAQLGWVSTLLADGWITAGETWTYASASTITVPSGAASRYQKGDRIKWTQTTVKYGVIVAVADTVLTIAVNTDYVVANAAITDNYYSRIAKPLGYPYWFACAAPTWVVAANGLDNGSGGQPTTSVSRMSILGNVCSVHVDGSGTKVSTGSEIKVDISAVFQQPANYSQLGIIGAGYSHVNLSASVLYVSASEWRIITSASIADNTAIAYVSFQAAYEF